MPLIQISLAEGRTPEQLRQLVAEVTEVAVRVANAPKEAVSVIITEVAPTMWATGDVTVQERRDNAAK